METLRVKMASAIGTELNLILACINPDGSGYAKIKLLLSEPIDWDLFMALAVHHRVYPMIFNVLNDRTLRTVPAAVLEYLREQKRNTAIENLKMTVELVRILRAMDVKGVDPVVLKGLPLANQLYGDIAMRPSRDLDLFVFPVDVEKANEILHELHYRLEYPSFEPTSVRIKNWSKNNHHFTYRHAESGTCLELHWQLGSVGTRIPLSLFQGGIRQVQIAGQAMTVLTDELLVIYLMIHGALHAWFRLRWLCDVGLLLKDKSFSWERLYHLAERLDLTAIVGQSVILAHELLSVPLPEPISTQAAQDKNTQRLVWLAMPAIVAESELPHDLKINMLLYYQKKSYDLALRSGFRNKLAFFKAQFIPSNADMTNISIPDSLHFLYYLLRPIQWLARQMDNCDVKK